MKQNIELHIEELVLHGFSNNDSYQIGDAVQREITRLLLIQGLPPAVSIDANIEKLNAGSFNLQAQSSPEVVGHNIAKLVYKGISSEKSSVKNRK